MIDIISNISKEQFKNTAVLVFTPTSMNFSIDQFIQLQKLCPKDCISVILRQGETMEFLSEEDMNKLGWYKKEVDNG